LTGQTAMFHKFPFVLSLRPNPVWARCHQFMTVRLDARSQQ
jgi:hypothetical protein